MTDTISKSGLLERWNISLWSLNDWRRARPSALVSVLVGGNLHFNLSQVLQAEKAGCLPTKRVTNTVQVDGEGYTMTGAVMAFKGRGIGMGTMRKRLEERPKCTSRWLLRPVETSPFDDEPLSERRMAGELMVDGTPMKPDRAARYIAIRSQRVPIIIKKNGWRVSVMPKAQVGSGDVEFYKAMPSKVAEWLAQ